ncbi:uncharacterized protein V6R79_014151 [Siganus canaliculatus]
MSQRDPFPSPKLENDFTLSGFRPLQRKTWNLPTHMAQMEEPWSRLYNTPTFASIQHSVLCSSHQALRDSLDFKLESPLDYYKDMYCPKYQTLCQKETFAENQRKEENLRQDKLRHERENGITVLVDQQRRSL